MGAIQQALLSYAASAPETHSYWRLIMWPTPYGGFVSIGEVEFRATAGGADQASGGTATGSINSDTSVATNAFDNNNSNHFTSTYSNSLHFIQYEFASPVSVQQVAITSRADSVSPQINPSRFTVQYSDNGTTWTDVFTVREQFAWSTSEQRLFTAANAFVPAGVTQNTLFNTADKSASATLAEGDRAFTNSSAAHATVRATNGVSSSQKRYFEWEFFGPTAVEASIGIGVANSSASLTTYLGNSSASAMHWFSGGNPYANGFTTANSVTGTLRTSYDKQIWGLAIDGTAGKVWLSIDGAWITGDPAAGTSPWLTYTPGSTIYPAVTMGSANNCDIRFPALTTHAAPSGFSVP